ARIVVIGAVAGAVVVLVARQRVGIVDARQAVVVIPSRRHVAVVAGQSRQIIPRIGVEIRLVVVIHRRRWPPISAAPLRLGIRGTNTEQTDRHRQQQGTRQGSHNSPAFLIHSHLSPIIVRGQTHNLRLRRTSLRWLVVSGWWLVTGLFSPTTNLQPPPTFCLDRLLLRLV